MSSRSLQPFSPAVLSGCPPVHPFAAVLLSVQRSPAVLSAIQSLRPGVTVAARSDFLPPSSSCSAVTVAVRREVGVRSQPDLRLGVRSQPRGSGCPKWVSGTSGARSCSTLRRPTMRASGRHALDGPHLEKRSGRPFVCAGACCGGRMSGTRYGAAFFGFAIKAIEATRCRTAGRRST